MDLATHAEAIAALYTPPAVGRPSRINDPDLLQELLAAIADGLSVQDATELAGIAEQTYYNWRDRATRGEQPYARLLEACKRAERAAEREALRNVRRAGAAGPQYWTASAWFCERKWPEKYGKPGREGNGTIVNVEMGVKDSEVRISVSTSLDSPSPLSPPLSADIHSLTPTASADLSPIKAHSVNQPEPQEADSGARSPERLQPGTARAQRRRGSAAKSAIRRAKEKKA